MKLIDKDAALAMIEELESQNNCGTDDFIESKRIAYKQVKDGVLEMQETVSMQDEPISEDLETEIEKISKYHFINDDFDKTELDGRTISNIARHFAAWQRLQYIKIFKELYELANHQDGCYALECIQMRLDSLIDEE